MLKYEDMHKNFCSNLKAARKQKRLTQEKFAKSVGIERSLYTKYETGAVPPTFRNLLEILLELDISADFMFGINPRRNIDK